MMVTAVDDDFLGIRSFNMKKAIQPMIQSKENFIML